MPQDEMNSASEDKTNIVPEDEMSITPKGETKILLEDETNMMPSVHSTPSKPFCDTIVDKCREWGQPFQPQAETEEKEVQTQVETEAKQVQTQAEIEEKQVQTQVETEAKQVQTLGETEETQDIFLTGEDAGQVLSTQAEIEEKQFQTQVETREKQVQTQDVLLSGGDAGQLLSTSSFTTSVDPSRMRSELVHETAVARAAQQECSLHLVSLEYEMDIAGRLHAELSTANVKKSDASLRMELEDETHVAFQESELSSLRKEALEFEIRHSHALRGALSETSSAIEYTQNDEVPLLRSELADARECLHQLVERYDDILCYAEQEQNLKLELAEFTGLPQVIHAQNHKIAYLSDEVDEQRFFQNIEITRLEADLEKERAHAAELMGMPQVINAQEHKIASLRDEVDEQRFLPNIEITLLEAQLEKERTQAACLVAEATASRLSGPPPDITAHVAGAHSTEISVLKAELAQEKSLAQASLLTSGNHRMLVERSGREARHTENLYRLQQTMGNALSDEHSEILQLRRELTEARNSAAERAEANWQWAQSCEQIMESRERQMRQLVRESNSRQADLVETIEWQGQVLAEARTAASAERSAAVATRAAMIELRQDLNEQETLQELSAARIIHLETCLQQSVSYKPHVATFQPRARYEDTVPRLESAVKRNDTLSQQPNPVTHAQQSNTATSTRRSEPLLDQLSPNALSSKPASRAPLSGIDGAAEAEQLRIEAELLRREVRSWRLARPPPEPPIPIELWSLPQGEQRPLEWTQPDSSELPGIEDSIPHIGSDPFLDDPAASRSEPTMPVCVGTPYFDDSNTYFRC